jgi:hypothetical protein
VSRAKKPQIPSATKLNPGRPQQSGQATKLQSTAVARSRPGNCKLCTLAAQSDVSHRKATNCIFLHVTAKCSTPVTSSLHSRGTCNSRTTSETSAGNKLFRLAQAAVSSADKIGGRCSKNCMCKLGRETSLARLGRYEKGHRILRNTSAQQRCKNTIQCILLEQVSPTHGRRSDQNQAISRTSP